MLRVLDLFSGIGGFSLGLERTGGFKTVAFCEIDPYCQKVLAKHWPAVPCHDDITTREFAEGEADVIAGGFPCQDISLAGEGAGLAGRRSGLWRELVRSIRLVRPDFAIVENVAALLDRGMGEVLGDLAEIGYDAEWHCIPASYIGAWHRRDRVWLVTYPNGVRRQQGRSTQSLLWQRNVHEQSERAFARWPGRSNLPTPKLCRGGDGVRARLHSLGNAVVPQIPELIGRAILAAELQKEKTTPSSSPNHGETVR